MGRMLAHFLGAVAEFERELIRERVRSGLANARAKGKRLERPEAVPILVKEELARWANADTLIVNQPRCLR
jgi:DNA invertase Pin-like site-specific DNA recombinase